MTDPYKPIREALAMGPTPGKRAAVRLVNDSGEPYSTYYEAHISIGDLMMVWAPTGNTEQEANAALAAACDPETIRALLAERDALAAEVASATEQIQNLIERMPK